MGGGGKVEKRGCKGRQSDPSGPDKAEWKTDECGEQGGEEGDGEWIYLGGYTVWHALSAPHPPFSSHHSTLTPFLPSQADLSNSLLPEERTKERRRQQRRECSPLSSFLSLAVIPSNPPNPLLGAIFHHGLPCVYYPLQNTSH